MNKKEIHFKALEVAARYRRSEIELIEILEKVDAAKICYQHGCNSTFSYAVEILKLSSAVASIFINVSRKTRDVPELKAAIRQGDLTVSKARKMTSVINQSNGKHWVDLASEVSTRKLEKQVAAENPRAAAREAIKYVAEKQVELKVGLSEKQMLQLRRAQEVLSQKKRRAVSLDETIADAAGLLLEKHDPLEKAKRHRVKNGTPTVHVNRKCQQRVAIPAATKHQVHLEAESRCTYINEHGERCLSRQHLEIHHIKPVSHGGSNTKENLKLLCYGHHRVVHEKP